MLSCRSRISCGTLRRGLTYCLRDSSNAISAILVSNLFSTFAEVWDFELRSDICWCFNTFNFFFHFFIICRRRWWSWRQCVLFPLLEHGREDSSKGTVVSSSWWTSVVVVRNVLWQVWTSVTRCKRMLGEWWQWEWCWKNDDTYGERSGLMKNEIKHQVSHLTLGRNNN